MVFKKKHLLSMILTGLGLVMHAQSFMGGLTLDLIPNQRAQTYALGIHAEQRIGSGNFYATWHFAIGRDSRDGFYASGAAYIPMWKEAMGRLDYQPKHLATYVVVAALPLALPSGIAYYFDPEGGKSRMGLALYPMTLRYWDRKDGYRTAVWTPTIGLKTLMHYNQFILYSELLIGYGMHVHQDTPTNRNGYFVSAQIGILFPGE